MEPSEELGDLFKGAGDNATALACYQTAGSTTKVVEGDWLHVIVSPSSRKLKHCGPRLECGVHLPLQKHADWLQFRCTVIQASTVRISCCRVRSQGRLREHGHLQHSPGVQAGLPVPHAANDDGQPRGSSESVIPIWPYTPPYLPLPCPATAIHRLLCELYDYALTQCAVHVGEPGKDGRQTAGAADRDQHHDGPLPAAECRARGDRLSVGRTAGQQAGAGAAADEGVVPGCCAARPCVVSNLHISYQLGKFHLCFDYQAPFVKLATLQNLLMVRLSSRQVRPTQWDKHPAGHASSAACRQSQQRT